MSVEKSLKLVLVGDGGTGKTNFVTRMIGGQFDPKYTPTLGVAVTPIHHGSTAFSVWDTAGQEKFGGLRDGYYVKADCALVFFDVTSRISFTCAAYWIRDLLPYTNKIVLVGNKKDIADRKVTMEQALAFTKSLIPYCEISCKTGEVTEPLDLLLGMVSSQGLDQVV